MGEERCRGERERVEGERREWAKKENQRTQKHAISGTFLMFEGIGGRELFTLPHVFLEDSWKIPDNPTRKTRNPVSAIVN